MNNRSGIGSFSGLILTASRFLIIIQLKQIYKEVKKP